MCGHGVGAWRAFTKLGAGRWRCRQHRQGLRHVLVGAAAAGSSCLFRLLCRLAQAAAAAPFSLRMTCSVCCAIDSSSSVGITSSCSRGDGGSGGLYWCARARVCVQGDGGGWWEGDGEAGRQRPRRAGTQPSADTPQAKGPGRQPPPVMPTWQSQRLAEREWHPLGTRHGRPDVRCPPLTLTLLSSAATSA